MAEQAYYQTHQNTLHDAGYRRFLSTLSTPLLTRLAPQSRGLDYGCGPGPALAAMLEEAGHQMALYDPLFYPDDSVLNQRYDFVTCSEVAEHFYDPPTEFDRLRKLLKPGGLLAVMTRFLINDEGFARWHYQRDPTHVVFYTSDTFQYIAKAGGWNCTIPANNVALLTRPVTPAAEPA